VLWHQLIAEMEAFSERTGGGLGAVWGLVHKGLYEQARQQFDQVKARLGDA
jgi:hypothetical protein